MSTHFRLSHVFRFPHQNSVRISLLFLSNSTLRTHLTDLDFISVIIFGEGYRRWNCSLYSFLHHRIISLLLAQIFSLVAPSRTPHLCWHCRPDLLKQSNFFALCLPPNFQCSTLLVKVLFLNLLVIFFLFLIAIFLSLATDKIWSLLHFLISSLNFGAQRLRTAFLMWFPLPVEGSTASLRNPALNSRLFDGQCQKEESQFSKPTLCSSPEVKSPVSHPYKTTCTVTP